MVRTIHECNVIFGKQYKDMTQSTQACEHWNCLQCHKICSTKHCTLTIHGLCYCVFVWICVHITAPYFNGKPYCACYIVACIS